MRRLFVLTAVLLLATPASSNTLRLEDQINAQLIVDVLADDGSTTSTDRVRLTPLLGGFVDVSVQGILDPAMTVSCYDPDPAGRPCGACDACVLRRRGFEQAGEIDPVAG